MLSENKVRQSFGISLITIINNQSASLLDNFLLLFLFLLVLLRRLSFHFSRLTLQLLLILFGQLFQGYAQNGITARVKHKVRVANLPLANVAQHRILREGKVQRMLVRQLVKVLGGDLQNATLESIDLWSIISL